MGKNSDSIDNTARDRGVLFETTMKIVILRGLKARFAGSSSNEKIVCKWLTRVSTRWQNNVVSRSDAGLTAACTLS